MSERVNSRPPAIGFVSVDGHGYWPGGRYYLQHIIRSLALLPDDERPFTQDVWWGAHNADDASFDEVRDVLDGTATIRPPTGLFARARRKLANAAKGRTDFGDLFRAAGVDILFPTSACDQPGVPLIYWIPDFQHKRRPDLHPPQLVEWFEATFKRKAAEADLVVLSSQDALHDYRRYLPEHAAKGRALPCASLPRDDWFVLDPVETARAMGLGARYFLICNQFTTHKNYLTIFDAVARLKARGRDIQIACTGHATDYKTQNYGARLAQFVESHGLETNIKLLGFLPRAEQMALFRGATAIVQPSLFEGWSTPAEDAKSLARPIILSDIAVHREKADDLAATFVAVDDVDGWAEALLQALDNPIDVTPEMERKAKDAAHERARMSARALVTLMREAVDRYDQRIRAQ